MPNSSLNFDYSQGRVFLQDGVIYCSPNCSRSVLLPQPQQSRSPFEAPHLNINMFKQPTWWNDMYGWMSFIPLSPSYISAPFEPFCWMPRIEEFDMLLPKSDNIYEKRYRMPFDDAFVWKKNEQLLVEAARKIRIWHKIPGNCPPLPSKFRYDRPHKTRAIAKKVITLARDWFTIWMGFLSYLIAQTKLLHANPSIFPESYSSPQGKGNSSSQNTEKAGEGDDTKPSPSPLPQWYLHLRNKHDYSEHWLDGLSTSTVYSYSAETVRAGIVFQWSLNDNSRPPIEWFLAHHIPIFFIWSNVEEQQIARNASLSYLAPPVHLLQEALSLLFQTPNLPLAGLVMQRYYKNDNPNIDEDAIKFLNLHCAPSFVREFTMKQYFRTDQATSGPEGPLHPLLLAREKEQRAAAQASISSFPFQKMFEVHDYDEKGKLYNHWQDFLDKREIRQKEFMKVANLVQKGRCESRAKKPPIQGATMYTWEKILSSRGHPVYMRVCVTKKRNESVYSSYRRRQKLYNPLENEWDMCSEFNFAGPDDNSENSYSDNDYESSCDSGGDDDEYSDLEIDTSGQSSRALVNFSLEEIDTAEDDTRMDTEDNMENLTQEQYYSRDIVEMMHYGYGYVSPMPGATIEACPAVVWNAALNSFGLHQNLSELDVSQQEQSAIRLFLSRLTASPSLPLPIDLHDLNDSNHIALAHLFDFPAIIRTPENLFLFYAPRSQASDWLLGIHSPAVALYVCRLILSNPTAHTIVTVARRLLEKGIQFRTLLGLSCVPADTTISEPYSATSFRPAGYVFTLEDFEAAMLQCKFVVTTLQGRAALLRGGIIGRIAKEYTSLDAILSGPSAEVTAHRRGYMACSTTPGYMYCDDELTDQELAAICGTYSVYTPFKGQESVKSWFPPPHVWSAHQSGLRWIEWTERDESFYIKRCKEIREHGGQPLTVIEWRSRMKGHKNIRILYENNHARAASFLDRMVPK